MLSGICRASLEDCAPRLLEYCKNYRVSKLEVWDLTDHVDVTTFSEGSGLEDALGILEFKFHDVKRIACTMTFYFLGTAVRCLLTEERWRSSTIVYGAIFLEEFLSREDVAKPGLRSVAHETCMMVSKLGASFIGLANEDDLDAVLLPGTGLRAPHIFLAVARGCISVPSAVRSEIHDGVRLEWLQSTDIACSKPELDNDVVRTFREHLKRELVRVL